MSGTTLVVGASGKFAGLVIPPLVEKGATVRGLVHKVEDREAVLSRGAREVVVGDITDRRTIEGALSGIDALFYIAPAFLPDEADVGKAMVAAAVAAGVRRFVFSSVIHPVLSALSNHAAKAPVEEAILDTDLEYVFLHPTLFFQNYAASWSKVVKTGVLAEPWSTETRFSRVDYRDVAEVAAIALAEERLLYGTFELCAEGWLNRHDVAAKAGAALGREIRAERVDPASLGDAAAPMQPMFAHYDRIGLRGSAVTLRAILGREPRTLDAYFGELASGDGRDPDV